MDFANEYYVRLYTRDTTTWRRLRFEGQTTLMHLLRKLDRAGVLDIEDMEPWEAVVLHCHVPEEIAKPGIAACLRLEVIVHRSHLLVAPRFREANETSKSDRQRQLELRERRRVTAMSEVPPERDKALRAVTGGHASDAQNVTAPSRNATKRNGLSRAVTLTRSRSRSVAVVRDQRNVTAPQNGDAPQEPTAAAASSPNGTNGEAKRVGGEDVAHAWAETIAKPGANAGAVHAHSRWRSDFEVIAAACNAVEGKPTIAMHAVIEWFWLAPDGPVQSVRIKRSAANPGHLAKHVSRDLDAAQAWWLKRRELSQPRSREATQ